MFLDCIDGQLMYKDHSIEALPLGLMSYGTKRTSVNYPPSLATFIEASL